MNRIRQTLDELGIAEEPEATLTRSGAFFALVGDLLLYSDGRGVRRMSLRAMTRIRSDERGVLKIETPAGTGLSVSLRGFDPAEVQPFFLRVRDATAYAKAQAARELDDDLAEQPQPEPAAPTPVPEPLGTVRAVRHVTENSQPAQEPEQEPEPELTVRPSQHPTRHLPTRQEETGHEEADPTPPAYQASAETEGAGAPTHSRHAGAVTGGAKPNSKAGWKRPLSRLQRWPKVLRITAGVLALFAAGLALYYLLAGAVASALWLLVAGLSGSVFMLASADALAVWQSTLDKDELGATSGT